MVDTYEDSVKEKRGIFKPNAQHDVPEVLSYMLDCLIGKLSFLARIVARTFPVRHTYLKERTTDKPLTIIEVPVKDKIDSFHHSKLLDCTRAVPIEVYKEDTEILGQSLFSSLPEILCIYLIRINVDEMTIRKNLDWVDYESGVYVPLILDPEVMVSNPCPYTLRAVIHHSGSFGKVHHTDHTR